MKRALGTVIQKAGLRVSLALALAQAGVAASPALVGVCDTEGCATGVAVVGDLAYVADGGEGLQIIEVSDPLQPTRLGRCPIRGYARAVQVAGRYAYLAAQEGGLNIVDIADSTHPIPVSCYLGERGAWDVAVSGIYAYSAGSGLEVLDVSNPARPIRTGRYEAPWRISLVALSGEHALTEVDVLDVSDPTSPVKAGRFVSGGNLTSIVVNGSYAYTSDYAFGLAIYDMQNPTQVVGVGACAIIGNALGLAVAGDYAYLAAGRDGIQVVNIAKRTQPVPLGGHRTCDQAIGVAVDGGYIYVADGNAGLVILPADPRTLPPEIANQPQDLATVTGSNAVFAVQALGVEALAYQWSRDGVPLPHETNQSLTLSPVGLAHAGSYAVTITNHAGTITSRSALLTVREPVVVEILSGYDTPGRAQGVALSGSYAYLADGAEGLCVLDVSDPGHPKGLGKCAAWWRSQKVAVDNTYAYVMDQFGLQVVDVSNPSVPVSVGGGGGTDTGFDVTVSDGFAYLSDGKGFTVFDVSDATQPVELGHHDAYRISWCMGSVRRGGYLYLAVTQPGPDAGQGPLQIFDVCDPKRPLLVGECATSGNATDVAMQGDYAYVADEYGGLEVINVSDPAKPVRLSSCRTGGKAVGVAVEGDHVFLADGERGVQVINVSDPAHPVRVGGCDTPGSALDLALRENLVYVADDRAGLAILRVTLPPYAPQIVVQPASPSILTGRQARVAVTATGSEPLSYQWYRGESGDANAPLPGATNAVFITPPLTMDQSYWVRVSNLAGTASSATARIKVCTEATASLTGTISAAGKPMLKVEGTIGSRWQVLACTNLMEWVVQDALGILVLSESGVSLELPVGSERAAVFVKLGECLAP